MRAVLALALSLFLTAAASAQSYIYQSGNVTPNHAVRWITNGIVGDGGTAANGFLSSIGVLAQGPAICQQSAAPPSPYNQICLGNRLGTNDGVISFNNYNQTSGTLYFQINGTYYQFPGGQGLGNVTGPSSSTSGDLAVWNNANGTLLADGGSGPAILSHYGIVGDNSHDDAAGFQSLCSDISSGKVKWVNLTTGATYKIWSTAPTTQTALCNMGAAQGVRWDFNGASFNVAYTAQAAQFTATISGTTLNVSAVASGTLNVGDEIDAGPNTTTVSLPTTITDLGTGSGGTGTYTISSSQTVGSPTTMYDRAPSIAYIFLIEGGQQIQMNDLYGTSAVGKRVSGSVTGVNWVECSNTGGSGFGCRDVDVERANVSGGLNGVAVARALGTGQWSWGVRTTGTFTNVGYPINNSNDGLNTSFDIVTNNAGRSYIGYNVWGVNGRINSTTGNELNDVEIAAYGYGTDISQNTTANININYVNRASTNYGASSFTLSHQQGDPVNASIATTISNVTFNMDILFTGTPSTELFEENSFTGTSGSQSPGDPGNTDNNIVFSGKVEGAINATYVGCLLSASNGNCVGFNGTSNGSYNLNNLEMNSAMTSPWAIGIGAKVTFQNYASPGANYPTFDNSYDVGQLTIRQPTKFVNWGTEPFQGLTRFVNAGIGATSTDGIIIQNPTAAAVNAQQWPPRIHFIGQGWKTNSTAASETVDFIQELQTAQGTTQPFGSLVWSAQINSGGYAQIATLSNTGALTIGVAGALPGQLTLCPSTGSSCVTVASSNSTANYSFFLPTGSGTNGQLFTSGGTGNPTAWITSVPVANGGTACTSASITCFNNITGFSATGTTGSGNMVFATSPTLTTPALGGSSTGVTTFASANASGTNYTITFPAATGTVALTSGVTSSFSAGTTGFTPNSATTGAITLAGTLVVANGGTNCSSASITCFNNITGLSAAGTTGTTSTNLVFSTSPTFITPTLGAATATSVSFSPTTGGIVGTTTNDSTTAGDVGEYVTSTVTSGSAVSLTNNTVANITSISLTAGDWDIWGVVYYSAAASTVVNTSYGSIATSNSSLNQTPGQFGIADFGATGAAFSVPAGPFRLSLAGSASYYLNAYSTFSVSTNAAFGYIAARRRR